MAGRPCKICSNAEFTRIAAEMVARGLTDRAVAERLGVGRMSCQRHRTAHVVAPAKALVEAANKGRDVREKRAEVLAAAEGGDPSAFVALVGIVNDLRKVHDRLERTADAAEHDSQRLAVALLSGQQLRAAEVRAKLGSVGGFASPKAQVAGGEGALFQVNINFSGRTERIAVSVGETPPTIDADAGGPAFLPAAPPSLAAAFGHGAGANPALAPLDADD